MRSTSFLLLVIGLCSDASAQPSESGSDENPLASQNVAVAAIRKAGGHVYFDYTSPGFDSDHRPVQSVTLRPAVTAAALEQLKQLTSLQSLSLNGRDVTDAGLAHLKALTNLEVLGLDGTRISDPGLPYLTGLSNLRYLHLRGTAISDAGLAQLKEALPNCSIEP